jgi:hypothetical protein
MVKKGNHFLPLPTEPTPPSAQQFPAEKTNQKPPVSRAGSYAPARARKAQTPLPAKALPTVATHAKNATIAAYSNQLHDPPTPDENTAYL